MIGSASFRGNNVHIHRTVDDVLDVVSEEPCDFKEAWAMPSGDSVSSSACLSKSKQDN